MAETISVRFDKDLQKDLSKIEKTWRADRSEVVRRLLARAIQEWKIEHSLQQIGAGAMSIGKASEECGISKWDIIELLKEKNIDWIGYTKKDLERDLANL